MKTIKVQHGDIITYKASGDHKWSYAIVINVSKNDFMIIGIDNAGSTGYLIGSLPSNAKVIANLHNFFSKTGNAYDSGEKKFVEIG